MNGVSEITIGTRSETTDREFIIFLQVSARTHNDSLDRQSGVEGLKQRDVLLGIAWRV